MDLGRPKPFTPFGESDPDDDIEIIKDDDDFYDDKFDNQINEIEEEDDLDFALISPLCCWTIALVFFCIGFIGLLVTGLVKAFDPPTGGNASAELRDMFLILTGIGTSTAFFCILFTVCGFAILIKRKRFKSHTSIHDIQAMVPYEEYEEDEEDDIDFSAF